MDCQPRSALWALHGQRVLDIVYARGDHDAGGGGAGGAQVVGQGGQQQVLAVLDGADRRLLEPPSGRNEGWSLHAGRCRVDRLGERVKANAANSDGRRRFDRFPCSAVSGQHQ